MYVGLQGINNWDYSNQTIENHVWYNPFRGLDPHKDIDPPPESKLPSSIADAVHRVLTYKFSSYTQFASTIFAKNLYETDQDTANWTPEDFTSLEFLHNNMHNFVGGTAVMQPSDGKGLQGLGHMSDVPVAAFDPIFFFYHK
jgi:tyrosinase